MRAPSNHPFQEGTHALLHWPARYYCGIDLHARSMYLCILEHESGKVLLHRSVPCEPEAFLRVIEPFRDDLVVGVECIFCWYWLADLCAQ